MRRLNVYTLQTQSGLSLQVRGPSLGEALRAGTAQLATVTGLDLQGANLRRAPLGGLTLEGADLRGADLRGAQCQGTRFVGADLDGADGTRATLVRADFTGARLTGTVLSRAVLDGAVLDGADLRDCEITGAQLRAADTARQQADASRLCQADAPLARRLGTALTREQFVGSVTQIGERRLAGLRAAGYLTGPELPAGALRTWLERVTPTTGAREPHVAAALEWLRRGLER